MKKRITIYDIANEAGVSTATVTRVLADSKRVRPETRERVLQVIDKHDYTPSASARSLDGTRSRTLAIIIPHVNNPYFAQLYEAAYEEAQQSGYTLSLFLNREYKPIDRELVEELIRRRVDGVLFAGGIWSAERPGLQEAIARLRRYTPVVAICPMNIQLDCTCIYSNLVSSVRLPVRHLNALGHRRIAFIGSSMANNDLSKRGDQFLEELRLLGLEDNPAYHLDAGYDAEAGERAVLRLLSSIERKRWPTALVCFNDLVALGAMKQLHRMGIRIPEEMAIVGFDDQFYCAYTDPALTSVDTHPREQARRAIRELLSAQEQPRASFSVVQEATLVIRESCGAHLGYRRELGNT